MNDDRVRAAAENATLSLTAKASMAVMPFIAGIIWALISSSIGEVKTELKGLGQDVGTIKIQLARDEDLRRRIDTLEKLVRVIDEEQRRRTPKVYPEVRP